MEVQVFSAEWDEEGVYFYQAYCRAIAEHALQHQRLGGPGFQPARMTWIKPSLAWVLYRSGYGSKHNQTSVVKVKVPHAVVAEVLEGCRCGEGGGGGWGRVQWDPARDLLSSERVGRVVLPRRRLTQRAIQIGVAGRLSELYVASILSIEDVTPLARRVEAAHGFATEGQVKEAMAALEPLLPQERPYLPACSRGKLVELQLARQDSHGTG